MFPVAAVIASTEARPMNASVYLAIITELDGQRSVLRLGIGNAVASKQLA